MNRAAPAIDCLAMKAALLLLCVSMLPAETQTLTVKAISHEAVYGESGGRSVTCVTNNCSIVGGFQTVVISQVVQANGNLYTLSCSGVPFRSAVYRYCEWLHFDGDEFVAEVQGKNMVIHARSGGNQGKEIKLKFHIADIRPSSSAR